MKSFYTLAALVAVVAAQAGLPECAVPCIREATESTTDCKVGDTACSCIPENQNAIRGAATSCVIEACGAEVAVSQVLPAVAALCEGGAETPAEPSAEAPAPAPSSEAPAEPSVEAPKPSASAVESAYPIPSAVESSYPVPSAVESSYPVPSAAEPSHVAPPSNGTVPHPTPSASDVPEAGAAQLGFMGVAAMVGLAALAL